MFYAKASKAILCGALAVFAFVAAMPTAEAGPVRVRFTPLFGAPFAPSLDWGGVVDIGDGTCSATGTVSNLIGTCAGQFSFLSATLTLTDMSNPVSTESIALNTASAQVFSVQRTGLTPADFQGAISTPFAPVQGTIAAAKYSGTDEGGWFSLVLIGNKDVQLYWFDQDPGSYFSNPSLYAACGKAGDNVVGKYRCGSSANTAIAIFQPVPEPSTYALLALGLGAVGFAARRRARQG